VKATGVASTEEKDDRHPRLLRSKEFRTPSAGNTRAPEDVIAAGDEVTGQPNVSPAPRQRAPTAPQCHGK